MKEMQHGDSDAALSERVKRHLGVHDAEPWPEEPVDTIAELLHRAARRGEAGVAPAAELAEAAAIRQSVAYDERGCEAAVRAGHHMTRAANRMTHGWSSHERARARDWAYEMYDRAACAASRNTRAWAHLKWAHALVDASDPKEAWHHAQMATFVPENAGQAAYYDQLHAALVERIKRASSDPTWLATQLLDVFS